MVLSDKVFIPERVSKRGRDVIFSRLVLARLNGDLIKFDLRRERHIKVKQVKRLVAEFYDVEDEDDIYLYDLHGGWKDPDSEITAEMNYQNRETRGYYDYS